MYIRQSVSRQSVRQSSVSQSVDQCVSTSPACVENGVCTGEGLPGIAELSDHGGIVRGEGRTVKQSKNKHQLSKGERVGGGGAVKHPKPVE